MRVPRVVGVVVTVLALISCTATSPPAASPFTPPAAAGALARIVSTGVLRVALHEGGGPGGGDLLRLKRAIAEELAKRMGVALSVSEFRNVSVGTAKESENIKKSVDDMRSAFVAKAWDVAFLSTEFLAADLQHSPPVLEIDVNYLLPPGSPIRSSSQVDAEGRRVVVVGGRTAEGDIIGFLKRNLKSALVESSDNDERALEVLRSGGADALAEARHHALVLSAQLPGSVVLDDRLTVRVRAFAAASGDQEMFDYITTFVKDARASGLIGQLIERIGVAGVRAAP